jgi:hypothetical protein
MERVKGKGREGKKLSARRTTTRRNRIYCIDYNTCESLKESRQNISPPQGFEAEITCWDSPNVFSNNLGQECHRKEKRTLK